MSGETATGGGSTETLDRARSLLGRYRVPVGLVLVVVLLRPVISNPLLLGYEAVAATILIWMVFVAAFNLLFGYAGLLSFGHAMFLGFGMYAAAIGVSGRAGAPQLPFPVAAAIGIAVAATVGYLLGRLTVEKGEIYFAFLTLAVAQAVEFTANRNPLNLTGGSNGVTQNVLPGFVESTRGQLVVVFGGLEVDWYWFVSAVFLVSMLALWQIVRSPFGRSLVAIRENGDLARAMGIDTTRYKVQAFTISAAFSALAGSVLMVDRYGASQETLSVITSGDTVLMAVLGGVRYFFGPIAGVFVWQFAEEFLNEFEVLHLGFTSVDLSGVLTHWQFFLGALFVVLVVVAPLEGIWGYLRDWVRDLYVRLKGVAE
ncbi:branched-chain amino acid ABC transporter permease [Haloarchaeobius iranensis]|uniref:Amino acid/amide ABC transporter membrane protein 2, HAAT family n=1 Tax=Haloarchaeobius iranensis TaxID=996166 RepID=A0A1G9Y830_9EURY|nr:branched-chain amino acid ABC transporter permease [Haloarchaeobius iranensis]SDN05177.1 amino acid/amide ABC transporter membrane protein 2, HAAT family [Haloarchaeobius iranensis]